MLYRKIRYCALLFFSFSLLGIVPLSQADDSPVIMVLGDSLSAAYGFDESKGWVSLLAEKIEKEGYPYKVVNASVSGETSTGGLARLPRLLDAHEPDWVILELGGNDGLRGQPLEHLHNNLTQIVNLSHTHGAQVLLIGMQIPPNYGARYAGQFANVFPELAQALDLPLVLFMLEGFATDAQYMQEDGIHPNAKAQPLILKNIWPTLENLLEPST